MLGRDTTAQTHDPNDGRPGGAASSKKPPRPRTLSTAAAACAAALGTLLAAALALLLGAAPAGAVALKAPALQFPWQENQGHRITGSGYGCGGHTGNDYYALDFDLTTGTPVTASATGQAHTAIDLAGALYVWIDHGNGFVSTYFHLNSFAFTRPTWVNQGQVVGYSGNTGNSTGPHLHFSVHANATDGTNGTAYRPEPMYGPYRGGNSGFSAYGLCKGVSSPVYTSKPGCPSGASSTVFNRSTTNGYYLVAEDGGVFNFGHAPYYGSMGGSALNAVMTGMARTYDNRGYWEVGADGGIFAFGAAPFNGSAGSLNLVSCIQGMAAKSNGGYWLVAADGGIFAYNAPFYGSMGGTPLAARIQGMTAMPDGSGYWEFGADGGVFNFGSAPFFGSLAGQATAPVTAMAATPTGRGYWMLQADGTVIGFGDAANFGSYFAPYAPAVGIAPTVNGDGYWITLANGEITSYGAAQNNGGLYGTINSPVNGIAGLHGSPPDFAMTAVPNTILVAPGQSGTSNITVSSGATFQGTVSFSVGAVPSGNSASVSPSSLTFNQNQAATATLTVRRGLTSLGAFTVTVTGCGNNVCHSVPVTVN